MRRLLLALSLILCGLAGQAAAQEAAVPWRILSVEPGEAQAYLATPPRKVGALWQVSVLWRYRDPLDRTAAPPSLLARRGDLRQLQIDCAAGTFKIARIRYFGPDLKPMGGPGGEQDGGKFDPAWPLFAALCGGKPMPGEAAVNRTVFDQLTEMGQRMEAEDKRLGPITFTPRQALAIRCSNRLFSLQFLIEDLIPMSKADPARAGRMETDYALINKAMGVAEGQIPKAGQNAEGRRLVAARNRLQADDPALDTALSRAEAGDNAPLLALAKSCNSELKLGLPATFGRW